ncbi:MAG: rod shape-determining protein MreC [Rhodospirillales bacterium]
MNDSNKNMLRTLQPSKTAAQRIAYTFLVLAAFGLMMLGKVDHLLVERYRTAVTDALAPVMEALSRPIETAYDAAAAMRELSDLRAENARLRQERGNLLQWRAAAEELRTQNRTLSGLLRFVPAPEAHHIAARVVADTGGVFAHSLLINAGARDGVKKGQAVVTEHGLAGRITGAGKRSARVLLITDLNSRVPVFVSGARVRAILAGGNANEMRLLHMTKTAPVEAGDKVVTSGHGGAFPPDLAIGRVSRIKNGIIYVTPFAVHERIEAVRVIDYGMKGILADVDAAGVAAPAYIPAPAPAPAAAPAPGAASQ